MLRALLALGLAVCFFLPWLSVSCSTQPFARSSGFDLLEGRAQMIGEKSEENPLARSPFAATAFPAEPALWGWIAACVLLVLLGVLGAAYGPAVASGASSLLAAGLLALYGWFFFFGFSVERELDEEQRRRGGAAPQGTEAPVLRVHREPALHVSAGLAAAILALGLLEGSGRRRAK
ncbi:MAG: hypothetical protein JNM84_03720 [Planctomycetes bacterium]|nr:hypothetical protein [Planctomycetota bacterium]